MALEFICSDKIEYGKKINIPRCANSYETGFSVNKINFYYDNPGGEIRLNFWKIPENARSMDFEKIINKIGGYITVPRFYDKKGKVLKIGNR